MIAVFPELLISLTMQCTLLLFVARFLVKRTQASEAADHLWSCCHLMILLLSLAGVLLPHARLFQGASILRLCHQATALPVSQSLWMGVFWLWIFVAAALTVNMLRSLIQISLLVRRAVDLQLSIIAGEPGIGNASRSLTAELEDLQIRVVTSASCATPFCWQLHRPVIVLPESLSAFPADELCAVIRHELAHLKARHPLRLFLQRLLEIGFWFHPLVWYTSRDAAMQRELSADCLANRTQTEVAAFLRSLVRLSESSSRRVPVLSIGLNLISGSASVIQRRVDQLLAIDCALPRRSSFALLPVDHVRSAVRSAVHSAVCLAFTGILAAGVWIPLNSQASGRTLFSPWPTSTATLLHEAGIEVRDYELDSHRIVEEFHDND